MVDEKLVETLKYYNHCRKYEKDFVPIKEYENILKARYNKISRIKKRLVYLLNNKNFIWFITFTFSDKYINKCDRTKKDLIKHSLTGFDFKYMLNIDYGKTTEREHYHCILGTDFDFNLDDHLKKVYPSFVYAEQVRVSDDSFKRLSKYINKLSNHCIKDSTKNSRMYFSFKVFDSELDSYSNWVSYHKRELALLDKANVTGKKS